MSGLSSTLYDSASIEIVGGHSAAAISGSDGTGRALSDVAHSSGIWYAEVELSDVRSSGTRYWGVAALSNTGSLNVGLGADGDAGYYAGFSSVILQYVNAGFGQSLGEIKPNTVGQRFRLWVDASARKMWIAARPYGGGTWGGVNPPSSGLGQVWYIPGSGAIRIALRPANGSGSDRNVLRFRSRHSDIDATAVELDGAQPWDARQVTVTGTVNTAHAAVGSTLRWAWFDHASPNEIVTAPTSVGTLTVGTGGAISADVWTSLDAGGVGSLLLMLDGGDVVAARSHYMPVAAP